MSGMSGTARENEDRAALATFALAADLKNRIGKLRRLRRSSIVRRIKRNRERSREH